MKRKGKVPFDPKVFLFRNSRPLSPLQLSHDRGAIVRFDWDLAWPRLLRERYMRRRDFIRSIGGAAMAWLLAAHAQQPAKLPTIGFLGPNTPAARSQSATAFVQRLREFGWIEQSECKLLGTVV